MERLPHSPVAIPDSLLTDPGFTPGRRHISPLLDLIEAQHPSAPLALKALRRAGPVALPMAITRAQSASPSGRAVLMRIIGDLARASATHSDMEAAGAFLLAQLGDSEARTRRTAAVALGKFTNWSGRLRAEQALASAARQEPRPEVRKALLAALGKMGGNVALDLLRQAEGDHAVADVRAKAEIMVKRTLSRDDPCAVVLDRKPPRPILVAMRCRHGLEQLLLTELSAIGMHGRVVAQRDRSQAAHIEFMLDQPPQILFQVRTMLSFAFPLRASRGSNSGLEGMLVNQLLSDHAEAILRAFTTGTIRYRIAWVQGGKRRALVFRVAEAVQRAKPDLVNDPTRSLWEVVVDEHESSLRVELQPRIPDPRFFYRRKDIPAASHPTLAAALVRIAGAHHDDVVWDPFVGSATELCERSLLGPYRKLIGSDRDHHAIEVARENLAAAGVAAVELSEQDARQAPPTSEAPTLIITNPPMGRRLERSKNLAPMLDTFIQNAARALAHRGRLIWISPFPQRTEALARQSGLKPTLLQDVDMGGFFAQIQAFIKVETPLGAVVAAP